MLKKIIFLIIFSFLFIFSPVLAENEVILPSQIGVVENVEYIDTDDLVSQTKQIVQLKLLSGESKNENIQIYNMLTGNPYYDIQLKKGTKVILHVEKTSNGIEYSIEDIKRSGALIWLSVLFCGLLLYVGKKKGLCSLISIAITIFLISNFLSPLIILGVNPVFTSITVCIISTALTMFLVGGKNAKSFAAVIGTISSLLFACSLSYITIYCAKLTGFTCEHSLFLYSAHPELDFVGIAVSMMILATLGAVMDVSMSISSTINEIYITDRTKTVKELFISGMNVGRDIIGTMANTLILVYLGGSLPLLLLAENIDLQKFINLNQVVTEISSALIGSIAIIICVPFTAIFASTFIRKYAHENEFDDIKLDCK